MRTTISTLRPVLFILLGLALSACDKKEKPYEERPVNELYGQAVKQFAEKDFTDAAKSFEEVERQHPYSSWAARSEIMAAYSYYLAHKYDQAIATLEAFIQLHPGHPDIAYAYYLRALCYYDDIMAVKRDQKNTYDALDALNDVLKRFPSTKYARDAKLKADFAIDHLAGKEMDIGRFYLKKKNYLAAINRFRYVIETYQYSTHVPEALHRLVECYLALGLTEDAQMVAAVLGYNFPGSEWYADSYYVLKNIDLRPAWAKAKGGWLRKVFG